MRGRGMLLAHFMLPFHTVQALIVVYMCVCVRVWMCVWMCVCVHRSCCICMHNKWSTWGRNKFFRLRCLFFSLLGSCDTQFSPNRVVFLSFVLRSLVASFCSAQCDNLCRVPSCQLSSSSSSSSSLFVVMVMRCVRAYIWIASSVPFLNNTVVTHLLTMWDEYQCQLSLYSLLKVKCVNAYLVTLHNALSTWLQRFIEIDSIRFDWRDCILCDRQKTWCTGERLKEWDVNVLFNQNHVADKVTSQEQELELGFTSRTWSSCMSQATFMVPPQLNWRPFHCIKESSQWDQLIFFGFIKKHFLTE